MKRNDFKDPFEGKRGCYLLSSSHLLRQRIFRTEADFVFGVNTLAILLPGSDVMLIAYCLMDNHIHLLLVGKYYDCLEYYDKVIHRLSQMLKTRYGLSGILKRDDVDIQAVTDDRQLKNEICYLHRNPYKARIASPVSYPWSSEDQFFHLYQPVGKKVSVLSKKEQERLFQTHLSVPGEYEYLDGRILNKSFVSASKAMDKFRDSVEYFDLLRRYALESEVEEAHGYHETIVFNDSEIQEKINTICRLEFHASSLASLDRKSLLRLARIASQRFGAGQKQLSRLLGIGKDDLDRFL